MRQQADVILSVARNDIRIWLRRPAVIITTLVPGLMFVAVVYFISMTVGTPPVALVVQDNGPAATRLAGLVSNSDGFVVRTETAAGARRSLEHLEVAAVITIPPSFDQQLREARPAPVDFQMNNMNDDITGDLRRSFGSVISQYYSTQRVNPQAMAVSEVDTHHSAISLAQFRIVPGLVLILTIAGIVNTALSTCEEFEGGTVKDLVLAPRPTWGLALGKVLGGWLTTVVIGGVVLAVGAATGLLRPAGLYWFPTVLMLLLIGLAAASLGVASGALLRRFQLVASLSVAFALYIFFLSGGVSVPGFLPGLMQDVGRFVPLHYGMRALEHVALDASLDAYPLGVGMMIASALAGAALSSWAFRRRLLA